MMRSQIIVTAIETDLQSRHPAQNVASMTSGTIVTKTAICRSASESDACRGSGLAKICVLPLSRTQPLLRSRPPPLRSSDQIPPPRGLRRVIGRCEHRLNGEHNRLHATRRSSFHNTGQDDSTRHRATTASGLHHPDSAILCFLMTIGAPHPDFAFLKG